MGDAIVENENHLQKEILYLTQDRGKTQYELYISLHFNVQV